MSLILKRLKLMRTAARVQRVHTRPTIYRQSVGEHTFGVLAILAEIAPAVFVSEKVLGGALIMALYHDVPESITGDVPAPTKNKYPGLRIELEEIEEKIAQEFALPLNKAFYDDHDIVEKLVKYADSMEVAIYAMEEYQQGNKAMLTVATNALGIIKKSDLTEITPEALELYELVLQQTKHYCDIDVRTEFSGWWPS